jgi:hypothetical protein
MEFANDMPVFSTSLSAASRASIPLATTLATTSSPVVATPAEAPVPAASSAPAHGLELLDLALDGLFTAGASGFREADDPVLEAGGHDPKNRRFTTTAGTSSETEPRKEGATSVDLVQLVH